MHINNLVLIKLMNVLKNNLVKNDIFVISGYGPFISMRPSKYYGIPLFVRPSVHATYDNISHLFLLLLIGHVVTYIVLVKGILDISVPGHFGTDLDISVFGTGQFGTDLDNSVLGTGQFGTWMRLYSVLTTIVWYLLIVNIFILVVL
jgi:hypothetical protein